MAYEKLNLADGDVLKAEHLAHMEDGIDKASVQSDWDQTDSNAADFIRNKPFGEDVIYSDVLEVSMTNEELAELVQSGQLVMNMYVKVSDSVVKVSDVQNGFTVIVDGETDEIPPEEMSEVAVEFMDGVTIFLDMLFVSIDEQALGIDLGDGLMFKEKGVYMPIFALQDVASVVWSIPDYRFETISVNQIDKKYVPDNICMFYLNLEDGKLYNDAGMTIETARNDVVLALNKRIVINNVLNGAGVCTMNPLTVYYQNQEYASLDVCLESKLRTLHTCEYTGS